MEAESVKLVYFSPTGTTKAVLESIARGLQPGTVERVDITTPAAREQPLRTSEHELLVLGVPVYAGRVPALVTEWLHTLEARHTPAVCVVVYGNRAYENALLELEDIVTSRGGLPIAGAAYVGEHSFSDAGSPIAPGRPDSDDRDHAERFGRQVREKLQGVSSVSELSAVGVPGTVPYGGNTELWDVDFIAVSDDCVHCGTCSAGCPVGAIDPDDSSSIDQRRCITCCACLRSCPQHARSMKPSPVADVQRRLTTLCRERKEPEIFL